MAQLSRDDIIKLAKLSRLDLNDSEIDEYVAELSSIVQYVEILQAVDTEGLIPTNQVTGLLNVTRRDEVTSYGYAASDLLRNVPDVEDDQIKVNRMVG